MLKTGDRDAENLRSLVAEKEARIAVLEARTKRLETELAQEIEKRGLDRQNLQAQMEARYQEDLKAQLEEQRAHYIAEYDRLMEVFKAAQRARFGKKSERFVDETGQQGALFETTEQQEEEKTVAPEDIEDITYKGKAEASTGKREKRKPRSWAGIAQREEVIPVSDEDRVCACCGQEKDVIGYETSQKLDYIPASYELVLRKREKVACRKGCGSVVTAALPESVIPRCKATEPLLSHIMVTKVLDRQPLYHQEQRMAQRYGWHITRGTMARWMIVASDKLNVLVTRMKEVLLDYDIAAIDATTLQVLNEPNRPAEVKSYAYCIRGGPPGKEVVLYEYNAYSQKDYVHTTLEGFKGVLHCDASPVTNGIGQEPGVSLSYCHAHARRKFEQIEKSAGKGKAKLAAEALRFYQRLYAIEKEATTQKRDPQGRLELRLQKSMSVMEEFKTWLQTHQSRVLPKSPIGQAITYCLTHWEGLNVYLTDGRVAIDNNATEREIKPFVIARKNFLFACTTDGADALGVHFSLILTAKLHALDPMAYYTKILTELPSCKTWSDYDRLLPWNVATQT